LGLRLNFETQVLAEDKVGHCFRHLVMRKNGVKQKNRGPNITAKRANYSIPAISGTSLRQLYPLEV